jgi:hypothetical protein
VAHPQLNKIRIFKAASLAAVAGLGLGFFTTFYMGAATFAFGLMISGMAFRRRFRRDHRFVMYSAMAIDLLLVLILEFSRDAIGTVVSFKLGPWQSAHVLASTLAVVLYLPLIVIGTKLWKSEMPKLRLWHRRLGILTFALRTLGFVLMFSLLWKQPLS